MSPVRPFEAAFQTAVQNTLCWESLCCHQCRKADFGVGSRMHAMTIRSSQSAVVRAL